MMSLISTPKSYIPFSWDIVGKYKYLLTLSTEFKGTKWEKFYISRKLQILDYDKDNKQLLTYGTLSAINPIMKNVIDILDNDDFYLSN